MILNQERRGERANECISTGKRDEMKSNQLRFFQQIDKTGQAIHIKAHQTEKFFENR